MAGWKRWTVALVALVAGAAVIVLALRSPEGLKSAASVGSLFAGLVPLVLALVLWARRPPSVALTTSTTEQVDAAQRELATQVLGQWREEINVRRLDDPGPLRVRWRSTELAVTREGPESGFTGWSDRIGEVAAGFRELKRRRLVILGAPGTGKTTLALLLLRELLEHPEPDEPVPVLLSMSGWDPAAESLPEWLARRLAEDYPALRATVFGPDAARALVAQRRILPVLDGLDELPEAVQPSILARLNETAADPLVLTCRTSEYRSAVTGRGGDALTGGGRTDTRRQGRERSGAEVRSRFRGRVRAGRHVRARVRHRSRVRRPNHECAGVRPDAGARGWTGLVARRRAHRVGGEPDQRRARPIACRHVPEGRAAGVPQVDRGRGRARCGVRGAERVHRRARDDRRADRNPRHRRDRTRRRPPPGERTLSRSRTHARRPQADSPAVAGFLDDAHRLGVLRRAGPVYQFRHAELQDRLAGTRR